VRSILAGHRTASGLPATVPTIATALRKLGYRTAMSGKWHLGQADGSRPLDHGFEDWFGFSAGCVDYYSHIFYWAMNRPGPGSDPIHDLWENDREVFRNGRYMTEMITEQSVTDVRRLAGGDEPFLLYVAYNAPHYPMHAPKKYVDRFPHLAPDRRIMAAMLSAMDDGVGEIVNELERQNVLEDTFIVFMSDNGPSRETRNWLDGRKDPYYGGTTGKLKGHKFSLYDGGIRVPGIMHWPAGIAGGQVSDEPVAAMDVFPTFLRAAGGDPERYALDGCDVLPALTSDQRPVHDHLFWEMGKQTAVRQGRWKLVLNGQLVEGAPPEDDVHLADLDADMAESVNLKEEHPDVTRELTEAAESWRAALEKRWQEEWEPNVTGTTTHPDKSA
jgi:arylsulfatase A-like enzyme